MKKWFKTLTSVVLSTAMACSAFAFIGCGDDNGSDGSGNNDNMFRDDDFADDANRLPSRYIPRNIKFAKDATFADGTTEKEVNQGEILKFGADIKYTGTLPENRVVGGWNDEAYNYYQGADFEVPRHDATLTPVVDVPEEQYADVYDGHNTGKIGTGIRRPLPDEEKGPTFGGNEKKAVEVAWYTGQVGNEAGGIYRFLPGDSATGEIKPDDKIPAGFGIVIQTPNKVVKANTYTVEYEFVNLSESQMSFHYYQTNGAASWASGNKSELIEIPVGESKKSTSEIQGWDNGNILIAVELTEEVSDFNLGIIKRVTKAIAPEDIPHKLTLQGAKFKDGTTEQMVDFDVTPEFDVEIPSGQKLVGWQNVNNPSEIFPAEFKMPARDITIYNFGRFP